MRVIDGEYVEVRDDSLQISRALTASGGPLFPPADWYKDPGFDRPTPITVTADGRISGHIAAWRTSHIGFPSEVKNPPHNHSDYAYFKTGVVQVDDGSDVQVGQITLAGGHASLTAGADEAVRHYDDTNTAVADVTIGEDAHGIWVSGGIRPGVTDEQIRVLRASAPSGDWRPIDNALELVAICQVNTPGFPVARAMVASGEITALVAAGASYMFGLQQERMLQTDLSAQEERLSDLESLVDGMVASLAGGKKKPTEDEDDSNSDEDDEYEREESAERGDDEEAERLRMRKKMKAKTHRR